MTQEHPASAHAAHGGLLKWLGFGRDDAGPVTGRRYSDPVRHARAFLLDRICAFLLDNGLEISAQNLAAAHSAFAGFNPGLERRIFRRIESGEAITQDWLDQATASDGVVDDEAISRLTEQLEQGIDQFSRSTQNARSATTSYGQALAEHVDALAAAPDTDDVIVSLADYARAMLERSRKAEQELRAAEEEADTLRHNLARARRDAEVDFLTGLPNRRAFEAVLEEEYRAAQAAIEPLCVAFCDIDHFKVVNDTHGHDAGDRVICAVADLLAEISGEKCHVARHGGEEFVLLLRGATAGKALNILDSAREKMAARKLVNRRTKQPFGQVTFSGGLADVFAFADPRTALAAADDALYRAKEAGRNRVLLAEPADKVQAA
ncbi:GGDEF domain-containing protein [Erythrobacter sp. EC-HK427]|uniref:GGDEF domain-containing protein n=1 Tax=Erythrobacter sp. EC-HK427 TaxID=2038396 RepID=UPI0012523407|nr:GGDEF domain-containing protein [Erythrobacter sp. EC-HK427]VVT20110.1 Diguanylate cyclase [Erythrobacter sp. EC-HK427]